MWYIDWAATDKKKITHYKLLGVIVILFDFITIIPGSWIICNWNALWPIWIELIFIKITPSNCN